MTIKSTVRASLVFCLALSACAEDDSTSTDDTLGEDTLAQVQPGEVALAKHGGTGGTPYWTRGEIVGIETRTGSEVDNLTVHFNGQPSQRFGGTGGTANFPLTCPVGYIVTGLHGRSGSRVDALGLHCVNPTTGSGHLTAVQGGAGGTPFIDRCTANQKLVGLNIRAGSRVDQVQLVCGPR